MGYLGAAVVLIMDVREPGGSQDQFHDPSISECTAQTCRVARQAPSRIAISPGAGVYVLRDAHSSFLDRSMAALVEGRWRPRGKPCKSLESLSLFPLQRSVVDLSESGEPRAGCFAESLWIGVQHWYASQVASREARDVATVAGHPAARSGRLNRDLPTGCHAVDEA